MKLAVNRYMLKCFSIYMFLFLCLWTWCNSTFPNGDLGIWNASIMLISSISVFFCMHLLCKQGIKCYIVFMLIYFGALQINTLMISESQTIKEFMDFYYIILGGFLFSFWLKMGEFFNFSLPIRISLFERKKLTNIIFLIYVLLSFLQFYNNGVPILGGAYLAKDLNAYKESGLSGLSYILSYVLLILSCDLKDKKRFMFYSCIILFEGILKVSRGNIFRILFFLILANMYKNGFKFNKKNFRAMVSTFVISISFFGVLGNIRTIMRGAEFDWKSFSWINDYINSNIDIGPFAWLYGYTAINFDTLKMVYFQDTLFNLSTFLAPFQRLLFGASVYQDYEYAQAIDFSRVFVEFNSSNMMIFLAPYIKDFGWFFFLELSLVGFMYMTFISICKNGKSIGLYSYITLLCALCICGNYIFRFSYLYVIIITIGILLVSHDVGNVKERSNELTSR